MMRWTLLLLVLLPACAAFRPKPAPVTPPDIPRIDCNERAPVEDLPRKPTSTNWRRWAAYSVRLLGVVGVEVGKRAEVADCLDRERKAGRIR